MSVTAYLFHFTTTACNGGGGGAAAAVAGGSGTDGDGIPKAHLIIFLFCLFKRKDKAYSKNYYLSLLNHIIHIFQPNSPRKWKNSAKIIQSIESQMPCFLCVKYVCSKIC